MNKSEPFREAVFFAWSYQSPETICESVLITNKRKHLCREFPCTHLDTCTRNIAIFREHDFQDPE